MEIIVPFFCLHQVCWNKIRQKDCLFQAFLLDKPVSLFWQFVWDLPVVSSLFSLGFKSWKLKRYFVLVFNFLQCPLTTVLVIIFCNFATYQYKSDSQKVKRNLVSGIKNLVQALSHEFQNNLGLRISGNIRKISNLVGGIAQCPVSLPNIKLWQQQSKRSQERYQRFLVLTNFIGLLYLIPNILSWIAEPHKLLLLLSLFYYYYYYHHLFI